MGCDIHCFAEIKVKGEWLHYGQLRIGRSYSLFTKMAGVRQSSDDKTVPIAPFRGLPVDITETTRVHYRRMEGDAHSASWMTSEEVVQLQDMIDKGARLSGNDYGLGLGSDSYGAGYLFGNSWEGFHKYRDSYPDEVEDFRWVFWFDC